MNSVAQKPIINAFYVDPTCTISGGSFIKVSIPELTPTNPTDNKSHKTNYSGEIITNTNYPKSSGVISVDHYITLPVSKMLEQPYIITKGEQVIIINATGVIEEGVVFLR